ncbi:MAG: phosphatase PAP2 family protein [Ignavibacteriales bacterium]|nr:phosphatase PAP2 family protein [Ignavibacteriales bacterium]
MSFKKLRFLLTPLDFVSVSFLAFLTSLNIVFASRVFYWLEISVVNIIVSVLVVSLAWGAETRKTKFLIGLHRWYCYPIVLFVFKELHLMVQPIHPVDYDQLFISIDRWMFGVHPTEWLYQFSHPVITEILQVGYFSYYLLFIILGVEIYRRFPIKEFDHAAFMIVHGFYLSYLGYFLLPAVGPRFVLHEFSQMNVELPGLFLTETLRSIIDAGESIPKNIPNPVDFVQRDVFPSGHTQLTLIVLVQAFQRKLNSRWLLLSLGTLLIIGTVYLRYHYVIDVIAGAVFCWITLWTGERIINWWTKRGSVSAAAS